MRNFLVYIRGTTLLIEAQTRFQAEYIAAWLEDLVLEACK